MSANDGRDDGSGWDGSRSLAVRLCVLNNFLARDLSRDGLPDCGGASEETLERDETPDAVEETSGMGEGACSEGGPGLLDLLRLLRGFDIFDWVSIWL